MDFTISEELMGGRVWGRLGEWEGELGLICKNKKNKL